jgi:hypothetical protein
MYSVSEWTIRTISKGVMQNFVLAYLSGLRRGKVQQYLLFSFSTVVAMSLEGWTEASAQDRCRVMDPTGTPLNVRTTPNGNIVGTLNNGSGKRR